MSHLVADIVCTIWPIDRTWSAALTPGQSGSRSNDNKVVLHILQIFEVGASPSSCLMSYPEHSLVGNYPSAVMQSVYSTAPAILRRSKAVHLYFRYKENYFIACQTKLLLTNKLNWKLLYYLKTFKVYCSNKDLMTIYCFC